MAVCDLINRMGQGHINRKRKNEPHLSVLLNAEKYALYWDASPLTLYSMHFAPHETLPHI